MLTPTQAKAVIRRYERRAKAFDRQLGLNDLDEMRRKAIKHYRDDWMYKAARMQRELDDDDN